MDEKRKVVKLGDASLWLTVAVTKYLKFISTLLGNRTNFPEPGCKNPEFPDKPALKGAMAKPP